MPDLATNALYSNRDDNVIFRDESGNANDAQLLAFERTSPSGAATPAHAGVLGQ